MVFTPKFYGIKRNNKFEIDENNRIPFRAYMEKFKEETLLEITVKRKYKKRTTGLPDEETNFNGYYWGVIVAMISEQIGEADRQATHEWIQLKTGNVKRMPDGTELPGSTQEMSGGDFAEMCARVRTWAGTDYDVFGEGGLYIPEPHEVTF